MAALKLTAGPVLFTQRCWYCHKDLDQLRPQLRLPGLRTVCVDREARSVTWEHLWAAFDLRDWRSSLFGSGAVNRMPVIQTKLREDGWPLCPRCGEDELWSAEVPADPRRIVSCLRCGWKPPDESPVLWLEVVV